MAGRRTKTFPALCALAVTVAACGGETTPAETTVPTTDPPTSPPTVTALSTATTVSAPTAPPATTAAPATTITATTGPPPTTTPTTTVLVTTTTEPGPLIIEIAVLGGVVEGEDHIIVERGTEIELIVTSDVSDEVHVHFYDVKAVVTHTEPAVIRFVADLPGIYEVELEDSHLLLLELEVR